MYKHIKKVLAVLTLICIIGCSFQTTTCYAKVNTSGSFSLNMSYPSMQISFDMNASYGYHDTFNLNINCDYGSCIVVVSNNFGRSYSYSLSAGDSIDRNFYGCLQSHVWKVKITYSGYSASGYYSVISY